MKVFLDLPYPPVELSPNERCHFRKKARFTKRYRQTIHWLAKGKKPVMEFGVQFHPPCKRKRDVQNAISAMKAGIDGLQDAWDIDDSEFIIHWPTAFAEPVKNGRVLLYQVEGA